MRGEDADVELRHFFNRNGARKECQENGRRRRGNDAASSVRNSYDACGACATAWTLSRVRLK
jgi:hypothetical protein